ncbi:insulin gene enhancer protein isl-1 isoform X3 [Nematostella vectensis]|uniref:insulin gene enhancer protein isl-1 isoform X3 n=1 Tax=Nematostella vectensis TaxID=45351 RepID=UPI0013906637|nr:insulin gene enhancer protein isl-1 isoform X3 [Nematostella vectensis]
MGVETGAEGSPNSHEEKRRVSMCVGCGSQIHDQYILRVAPDLEWHASCLKCADCHMYLDEKCTCFVREGKTYCKRDYVRLFGTKCAKCSLNFSKNDFVMRARNKIYHIDCFRCVACSRQLVPGDEFALREDGLFCKADHEIVEKATATAQATHVRNNGQRSSQSGGQTNGQTTPDSTPSKRKTDRPTRVRTVLNEKQLHTLRTCYNANPRPDAMMKEQLVEMTGLSPRVIRVWFQNKRCKDKKKANIILKSQPPSSQCSSDDLQNPNSLSPTGAPPRTLPQQTLPAISGVPYGNSGSMRPDAMSDMSGYQPWKALNDFAMHSEMDQGAFQQLVHFSEQAPGSLPPSSDGIVSTGN